MNIYIRYKFLYLFDIHFLLPNINVFTINTTPTIVHIFFNSHSIHRVLPYQSLFLLEYVHSTNHLGLLSLAFSVSKFHILFQICNHNHKSFHTNIVSSVKQKNYRRNILFKIYFPSVLSDGIQ